MPATKVVIFPALFLLAVLAVPARAQQISAKSSSTPVQKVKIGVIDFFGYGGLDLAKMRAAFPVRLGQEGTMDDFHSLRQQIHDSVQTVTGKPPTDTSFVCCTESGDWMLYIGLSGTSSKPLALNDPPRGTAALPQSALDLNKQVLDILFEAIQRHAGEDDSKGYFLSDYPPLREKQLAIRDFAVHHEDLIIGALENSSSVEQRQVAAEFLGYAEQSNKQLNKLAQASFDPDDGVRNNAIRALLVLSENPAIAARIPPEKFIATLCSDKWTDRNKGSSLVGALTSARNSNLLKQIRAESLPCLAEIAGWQSTGHAYSARMTLGRIAGIEEKHLEDLAGRPEQTVTLIQAAEHAPM
jgi:hypothetical protein